MDDIAQQLLLDLQENVSEASDSLLSKRLSISESIQTSTNLLTNEKETVRDIGKIYGQFSEKLLEISDLEEKRYDMGLEERTNALEMIDLAEQKNELLQQQTDLQELLKNQASELSDEQITNIQKQVSALDTFIDDIGQANEHVKTHVAQLRHASSAAQAHAEAMTSIFDRMHQMIEFMPGGSFIANQLNLEEVGQQFQNKVTNVLAEGAAQGAVDMQKIQTAGKAAFAQIGAAAKQAFSLLLANPMILALGAIAGAVALTVSRFNDLDQAQQEFQKNLGLSYEQSAELRTNIRDISADMTRLGMETGEVYDITRELGKQYGGVRNLSEELIRDTSLIAASLGLGAEEAAGMMKRFDTITQASDMTREQLFAGTKHMAEMAGVAPGAVMKDMVGSAEDMAKFIGENPEQLAEAAVYARQLGIQLSDIASIAENLIDFESSIQSQLEASVLAGRQINLNQARRLAFMGETKKATEAALDAVGSLTKFNQMNAVAQQSVADAIGVGVGKLETMLKNEERRQKLTEGTLSMQKALQEGMTFEEALDAQGVLTPMQKLQSSFKALTVQLGTFLVPLIESLAVFLSGVATALETVLGWLKPVTGLFDDWNGTLKTTLQFLIGGAGLVMGLKLLTKAFSGLGSSISGAAGSMKNFFSMGGSGGGFGKSMSGLFNKINPKNVAMFAAGAAMMAGALWTLAKAFQEFQKVDWENWQTAILPALGSLVVMGGALLAFGQMAAGAAPGILMFGAAMITVAGAIWIFAEAVQGFAAAAESILGAWATIMDSVGGIIDSISNAFETISDSIVDIVNLDGYWTAAAGILTVASAISTLAGSLEELNSYRGTLNDMSNAVVDIQTVTSPASVENAAGSPMDKGTGMTGTTTVSQNQVVAKLDELMKTFKNMQIAVYIDGKLMTKNVAKHGDVLAEALPKNIST